MPTSSTHDVVLVRYPFSDVATAKVRPAVSYKSSRRSAVIQEVPGNLPGLCGREPLRADR
jgi:hypothetical protein